MLGTGPAIFGKYLLNSVPREGEYDAPDRQSLNFPSDGSGFGSFSPLTAGALGMGAVGMGLMLGQGKQPLPPQFLAAESQVPELYGRSSQTYGQGQALVDQATEAYGMAQRGELTPQQAAQLQQTNKNLHNQAKQTYANMGRDMKNDTSAISTEANIDERTTAMAQSFIQSTIALATSEMGAGSNLIGQSLGESNAATNILMTAGKAQMDADKAYSDAMASTFGAIGKVFGTVAGAYFGGPAGAAAGSAAGEAVGKGFGKWEAST